MAAAVQAGPSMRALVEQALAQVPRGRVTTYGDIARALGDVRAARAVGEILATNATGESVPCHRVVMNDGSLGGYAFGGARAKARRLQSEGVRVLAGRVDPLEGVAVRLFELPPVFATFARRQRALAARVRLTPCKPPPRVAIGVDAAYGKADRRAFAAACAVDLETQEEVASALAEFAPPAPYVPGYLAFRELPGIAAAVRKLPASVRRGAVLFVDGQGILHPRRCGIASMAGLELKMPALGIAKSLLIGSVNARARRIERFQGHDVTVEGEVRGLELRSRTGSKALYVSPGTAVSVLQAAELAASLWQAGDESPLPVMRADALCRRARATETAG